MTGLNDQTYFGNTIWDSVEPRWRQEKEKRGRKKHTTEFQDKMATGVRKKRGGDVQWGGVGGRMNFIWAEVRRSGKKKTLEGWIQPSELIATSSNCRSGQHLALEVVGNC